MSDEDAQKKLSQDYQDALEDVHTRFILNLPPSELDTADRMFFQLEQAWWFYEDWICDKNPEKNLPRFNNFKPFAKELFQYSALLPDVDKFTQMWIQFAAYKRGISNYGCILLSQDYSKVVLCQVWNGKSVTFPAGKVNQGEEGVNAAARETYEETGFDASCTFGLTAEWKNFSPENITWKPLQEQDALIYQEDNGKRRTCYVCHGVPLDFPFEPVARKEVSTVKWYSLDDRIPKSSYAVIPFISQLRKWIKKHKRSSSNVRSKSNGGAGNIRDKSTGRNSNNGGGGTSSKPNSRSSSRKKGKHSGGGSRNSSRSKVREDSTLVSSGLAEAGQESGWCEHDMFKVNEKLMGRKVTYDGNPHAFEEGFGGNDPHAFHVVGGGFLNTGGISSLAPPPESSRLQPLFRKDDESNDDDKGGELQPFFSDEGATPWGETVAEVKGQTPPRRSVDASAGGDVAKQQQQKNRKGKRILTSGNDTNIAFMTDAEITARSQVEKGGGGSEEEDDDDRQLAEMRARHQADLDYIQNWVAKLPKPKPTEHFGTFRLDADAIMAKAIATILK